MISPDRILEKLDQFLHQNDYAAAERHLCYWLRESLGAGDVRTELLVRNELMGLYRKQGCESEAIEMAEAALDRIRERDIAHQVGAATTYLNAATVYKAFGRAQEAMPLFEHACAVYERELDPADARLGGLYNNMALALVDLCRFAQARAYNEKAISVMQNTPDGALEVAITYLNMASAAEAEQGLEHAEQTIAAYVEKAWSILENPPKRDGYYAFVCEKCATVFGYYGYFYYEKELSERARRIYAGN